MEVQRLHCKFCQSAYMVHGIQQKSASPSPNTSSDELASSPTPRWIWHPGLARRLVTFNQLHVAPAAEVGR